MDKVQNNGSLTKDCPKDKSTMYCLDSYPANREIDKNIQHINDCMSGHLPLMDVAGFMQLRKITNAAIKRAQEDDIIGYLNHIWILLLFDDNDSITIRSISKPTGNVCPDILFDYADKEYVVEIKTIYRKGYDHKVEQTLDEHKGPLWCEIPDSFGDSCCNNPFFHQGGHEQLKKLIQQLDSTRPNIVLFVTDFSPMRDLDHFLEELNTEIMNGYEILQTGGHIDKNRGLVTSLNSNDKNGMNYIRRYVKSMKLFVISDGWSRDNKNIIVPKQLERQLCVAEKGLLSFLRDAEIDRVMIRQ